MPSAIFHTPIAHRLVWQTWGSPDKPAVLCLHGLARQRRDFTFLANTLSPDYHVIALDFAGHGESDRLPGDSYGYEQYAADVRELGQYLELPRLAIIGSSLGGSVGMMVAADMPVETLVINDIGTSISLDMQRRVGAALGQRTHFPTREGAARAMAGMFAKAGGVPDAMMCHLNSTEVRRNREGFYMAYDPGIATPYAQSAADLDFSRSFAAVACPTLIVRGETSSLVPDSMAQSMRAQKPESKLHTVSGAGHLPSLMQPEQIEPILDFLHHHFAP